MMTLESRLRHCRSHATLMLCIMLTSVTPVFADKPHAAPRTNHSVAERLARRIATRYGSFPNASAISDVINKKNALLQKVVSVTFSDSAHPEHNPPPVHLALAEHPDWIVFDAHAKIFVVDERSVRNYLEESLSELLPKAVHAAARTLTSGDVTVQGSASAGYVWNSVSAAKAIVRAFKRNDARVTVDVAYEEATLILVSDSGVTELQLLSRGLSDFAKSPSGREMNIRHALNTYLNGIVIQANQQFSFNNALADSFGWAPALIISDGALIYEPGGGICQAASTIFRAALLAGLPITKRANHSLYVGYYEEYGVGLDATVYSGKQDLTFRNDTGSPIVVSARNEGSQAIVELYGKPDGRTVDLQGPFFSTSNNGLENRLRINQIGWKYGVTYPDGRMVEKPIVSTYTMLPRILRTKYAEAQGKRLLREIVPNEAEGLVGMR